MPQQYRRYLFPRFFSVLNPWQRPFPPKNPQDKKPSHLEKTDQTRGIVAALESDSSGKLLFVLTHNPDQLIVVNGSTRSIVKKYEVVSMADNILYNQTLNRVYVSERGNDSVSVVDLESKKLRRLSIGKSPISMAYDKF